MKRCCEVSAILTTDPLKNPQIAGQLVGWADIGNVGLTERQHTGTTSINKVRQIQHARGRCRTCLNEVGEGKADCRPRQEGPSSVGIGERRQKGDSQKGQEFVDRFNLSRQGNGSRTGRGFGIAVHNFADQKLNVDHVETKT